MELKQIMEALSPTEQNYLETQLSNLTSRMIQNSDVELTAEEIGEALLKAKTAKGLKMQYEENEKLRRKKSDEIMLPFSADQLIEYCKLFYFVRTGYEFMI